MRLAELTKRVSRQQLYRFGNFSDAEIRFLERNGWRVIWRQKSKRKPRKILQQKKNGIAVERVV